MTEMKDSRGHWALLNERQQKELRDEFPDMTDIYLGPGRKRLCELCHVKLDEKLSICGELGWGEFCLDRLVCQERRRRQEEEAMEEARSIAQRVKVREL